jgi:TonB family protein
VEVEGKRVILALRSEEKDRQAIPKQVQVIPVLTSDDIRIHIQIPTPDKNEVNRALAQIFQSGQLLDRVSAYWKPTTTDPDTFKATTPNGVFGELEGSRPVYLVKPGITEPPRAFYSPEPEFTDAARRSRTGGTTQLEVIINEAGFPEVLEIVHALGEGLDIQSLATVAKWRFHPATREGKPVAVMVSVEVTFQLR